MKRIVFLIPAIISTIFYGYLALDGIGALHPVVAVWMAMFWIAGVLLNNGMYWGGLFGLIPAVCFIYMGTQETGQIISETPIGIIVLLYYAVCIYLVYKKNFSKSDS